MSAIDLDNLDLQALGKLAVGLARRAQAGDCIALKGDLGAGKTTFCQYFIGELLATPQAVTSPTFNIVQWYDARAGMRICHADLYRLKHSDELQEIGLEEAYERHILLVEWPEIAKDILPASSLHITITQMQNDCRSITFAGADESWKTRLEGIENDFAQ